MITQELEIEAIKSYEEYKNLVIELFKKNNYGRKVELCTLVNFLPYYAISQGVDDETFSALLSIMAKTFTEQQIIFKIKESNAK